MADLRGRTAYFLVGPTASGKGQLARALARRYVMEIVSMDSMKVYRRMDIGTAKPGPKEREGVPHHLIDVVEPSEPFDLATWIGMAEAALLEITARGRKALFCGGTGLYLQGFLSGIFQGPSATREVREALEAEAKRDGPQALHARLSALDEEAGRRIHPHDLRRLIRALEVITLTGEPLSVQRRQFSGRRGDLVPRLVGLRREKGELFERIGVRLEGMMARGFLEEVRVLAGATPPVSPSASQALGYRELMDHLAGEGTLEEAVERIRRNTQKFVRRQMTWFHRFPDIHWLPVQGESDVEVLVEQASAAFPLVPGKEFP
ncbi:MAG: tRNA (adenosine(37)-N6)-dimethylallyltransferase MiaA [Planctomycetota bacterium]|jgi:tRNA dimethylallyltransferase